MPVVGAVHCIKSGHKEEGFRSKILQKLVGKQGAHIIIMRDDLEA
jgi:hypothetical protein